MSEIREFKTESKRLLELMINSIYSNKEIFLRELISNASDAIDKYHYLSLTDDSLDRDRDYEINLEINKVERTLLIKDNGIGMTKEEMISSLGTIAKSGSLEFMEKIKDKNDLEKLEIIGQFGVGFYSAYMVADKVEVVSKSPFSEKAYRFVSNGTESYEIDELDATFEGTEIKLFLRDDEEFNRYLEQYEIRDLVEKYSDYIRYPIKMAFAIEKPKLDEEGKEIKDQYDTVLDVKTMNSMTPIWKKKKSDVTDEELNSFYKQKYFDYQEPLTNIFINIEGALNYTALVFIPKKAPYDLYSDKYEKGLQLYSKGVFIMDKCKDLVPDYLRFIKGLVDSSDLSLNISRELLQQSQELEKIGKNVEKKIVSKLETLLKNDREKYIEFFDTYGINLKYGIYDKYGLKKDLLKDLILYHTILKDDYVTLNEYVESMKEGQEFIYYASGKDKDAVNALPQMDLIKKQGYDVLVLTDDVDEFMISILQDYNGKKFKSINQGDLDLISKEEKEKIDQKSEDKKSLLEKLKKFLKDDVKDVVLSKRLDLSPVCLVSEDGLSFEMEKVMSQMPNSRGIKATRILEINPNHKLFEAIENLYNDNDPLLETYAKLLYDQALLIEGMELEDPIKFSNMMCELMIKSAKY